MINTRVTGFLLAFYFMVLLGLAPINLLSFDTYYYWEWSRHLALSYYDGSPMIAYLIKLATSAWGHTLFALSLVGILTAALTSWIIYKTARFFLSKEASYIATLSWLFSPLVTLDILKQTTYDTPLTLFWALTLYFTVKFLKTNNNKELYLIGASTGLMMLSKYSGIVLILALLLFLISSPYRSIFKNKHFYLSLLLSLGIFSPVIIWNYQHQWQSFIYQLTTHQLHAEANPLVSAGKTFIELFLPCLNVMLIPPFLWGTGTSDMKNGLIVKLCRIVSITFLCFYLYTASKAEIREYWLAPYLISSALLLGYCFEVFSYRKLASALVGIYVLISFFIVIDNNHTYPIVKSKKLIAYHLIKQFNADYPLLTAPVLTSGWFAARMLFFLNHNPTVYTLGCDTQQNQYAEWSTAIHQQINEKTLKEALYIDIYDRSACLAQHFSQCQRIPTRNYAFKQKEYSLYVYRCSNP
ncbi:glycosyltransferase family 39 protein [Legionella saoudiensis]|uniref:glycosyltransferase family 39 protein n=1 Tax=Legionella saoudiensis TaxID=1750561 RepID=UPI0007307A93|nr:glycosyltransferase family 39 protein [Legionella saoudiensis]